MLELSLKDEYEEKFQTGIECELRKIGLKTSLEFIRWKCSLKDEGHGFQVQSEVEFERLG